MKITFAQMGFLPDVTESSATPNADGYVGTFGDYPYHIHPTETPDSFAALVSAIADGSAIVAKYLPPAAPSLEKVKADRVAELAAVCQAQIVGGFASSALAIETAYPSLGTDQLNLQSAVQAAAWNAGEAGWTTPLWCAQGGTWAFAEHTAAQVQAVNVDWVAYRRAAQQKYADLIRLVNEAATVEAVNAIFAAT